MRKSESFFGILLCLYVGCKQSKPPESDGNTTSSEDSGAAEGQSATGAPASTNASTSIIPTTSDSSSGPHDSSTSSGMLPEDLPANDCEIWMDDCRPGSKCVPYTQTAYLSNTHCVPLPANPKHHGESCKESGELNAPMDDCDRGLVCWFLDEVNSGLCIHRCALTDGSLMCPEIDELCLTLNQSGTQNVCIHKCDPIDPVCSTGATCYVEPLVNEFLCLDASDPVQIVDGAPCTSERSCSAGLLCVEAQHVPGCMENLCCTKFCDLDLAGGCVKQFVGTSQLEQFRWGSFLNRK